MSKIKSNYIVTKQNEFNEIRPKGMTLQELRFFIIYLSKINPKDENTRVVRFSVEEFRNIMKFERISIPKLKNAVEGLLSKVTTAPIDNRVVVFQFFKECIIGQNENGEWYFEFDCHDRIVPHMFDLKGRYFKYELWNTLRLKSKNQLRMYEILKQYERIGYRVLSVDELKKLLGIDDDEYLKFNYFKRDVLEVCKKSLSQNTDISFDYEPYGKKGRGGKIIELKFTVTKNKDFKDPLSLEKFIDLKSQSLFYNYEEEYEEQEEQEHEQLELDDREEYIDTNDLDENGLVRATGRHPVYEERITYLMDACLNEFNRDEVVVLFDEIRAAVPHIYEDELHSHDYLQRKYREMVMRRPTTSRLGYLRKLIAQDKR